jgi:uncharacterized protein
MEDPYLFDDVFCIPYEGQYIVYLPLRGIILLGNTMFVNLLYQARLGHKTALNQLGVDKGFVAELFESEKQLKHLTKPRPLPEFKPTSISIFLTNDCTLRCVYCYAEGGKNTISMPWETITGVLDEILGNVFDSKSKQMTVNFHGGDVSAVWPLFVRTMEHLHDITEPHGIRTRTSVGLNGCLNTEQREWIVQHIDGATLSIDGPPDIQNAQRPGPNGGPSFEYVSETLHALDAANFSYGLRSTITAESIGRLEEIIAYFCEHFETKKIKVEPMYPRGRGANIVKAPDAATFVEHFRRARDIARKHGRELSYSGARMEVLSNVFCQAAGGSCAVTPDGWVTSCYEVLGPSDPLADIFFYGRYDPQTRKMIVDDERRQQLFNLSVLQKPFCAKCFCKWHCAGDCPVKALHAERSPSPDLPDRCYITRELTRDQLIEALNGGLEEQHLLKQS